MKRRDTLVAGAALLVAGRSHAGPRSAGVTLQTGDGIVVLDVLVAQAPLSAAAFLAVVEAGGYAGGAFTRVVRPDDDHGHPPISVVQAKAGPAKAGGTAPAVAHESTRQTGLRHLDGTVSLPRDGVGTATGAEFFVCVGDQPALDFGGMRNPDGQGFAAFGRVVSGMDVVRRIWGSDASGVSSDMYTAGQMLRAPVAILAARRG